MLVGRAVLGPDRLGLAVGLTVAAIAYATTRVPPAEHFHLDAFLAGLRRRDAGAPQPARPCGATFRDHSPVNAEAATPSSVDITDYVAVIRRHWKLVAACGAGPDGPGARVQLHPPDRLREPGPDRAARLAVGQRAGAHDRHGHRARGPQVRERRHPGGQEARRPTARSPTCAPTSAPSAPTEGRVLQVTFTDNTARAAQQGASAFTRRLHRLPDRPGRGRTRSSARDARRTDRRRRRGDRRPARRSSTAARSRQRSGRCGWTTRSSGCTSQRSTLPDRQAHDRRRGRSRRAEVITPAILPSGPQRSGRGPATASSGSWPASSSASASPSCGTASTSRCGRAPTSAASPACRASARSRCCPSRCATRRSPSSRCTRRRRPQADAFRRLRTSVTIAADEARREGHRGHQRGGRRGQVHGRRQPGRHARAERPAGAAHLGRSAPARRSRACSRCRPSRAWSRCCPARCRSRTRCTAWAGSPSSRPAATTTAPPTCCRRPRCARSSSRPAPATTSRSSTRRRCSPWPTCSASPRMVDGLIMVVAVAETSEAQVADAADQIRASGGTPARRRAQPLRRHRPAVLRPVPPPRRTTL